MTDQLAAELDEGGPVPNPEAASDDDALDQGQVEQADAEEQETIDDDGLEESTEQPAMPETVEIEIDGQKYSVPAAIKDGWLRHSDYTAKTTELAEERKALEARQTAIQQQAEQHKQQLKDYGELAHTDALLEQFDQVDWNALSQNEPDQAQQLALQFQVLQRRRSAIAEQIQTRENEARVSAEREYANRKDQLAATLARDVPNYTPAMRAEMVNAGTKLGFSQEQIERTVDPKFWRALHYIRLGQQVEERQKSAANPKPSAAAPQKPVAKATGGGSPTRFDPNSDRAAKMSMEQWAAAERKRVAKRYGR